MPVTKLSFLARRAIAKEYELGNKLIKEHSIGAIAKRYRISTSRVSAIAREHGVICRHYRKSPSPKSPSTYSHPTSSTSRKQTDTDIQPRSENL